MRSGRRRNGNRHRVRLCPDRLAGSQVQAVHRYLQLSMIHVNQQVVVVDFLALKGIVPSPLNGIGMRRSSAAYKVSNAVVFMALIIVDVSGKDHDAERSVSLAGLQHFRKSLFGAPRGMPSTQ